MNNQEKPLMSVQSKACSTCIYGKNSASNLSVEALEAKVKDEYVGFKTFRACHQDASNRTCCRGFWDRHRNEFQTGQIAQRLDLVRFVSIENH